MITRIRGTLESIDGHEAVITDPAGYTAREVLVPMYLADRLIRRTGEQVTLWTLEYLEAVGQGASFIPRMLGFADPAERDFFQLFTTVKGLGNKRALRALVADPPTVAAWIAAADARSLITMPEVGKRLAETIIAELRGKVERFIDPGVSDAAGGSHRPAAAARLAGAHGASPAVLAEGKRTGLTGPAGEAVEVLVALGETLADAERMVSRAIERDPDLIDPTPSAPDTTDRAPQAADAGVPRLVRAAYGAKR